MTTLLSPWNPAAIHLAAAHGYTACGNARTSEADVADAAQATCRHCAQMAQRCAAVRATAARDLREHAAAEADHAARVDALRAADRNAAYPVDRTPVGTRCRCGETARHAGRCEGCGQPV